MPFYLNDIWLSSLTIKCYMCIVVGYSVLNLLFVRYQNLKYPFNLLKYIISCCDAFVNSVAGAASCVLTRTGDYCPDRVTWRCVCQVYLTSHSHTCVALFTDVPLCKTMTGRFLGSIALTPVPDHTTRRRLLEIVLCS